MEIKVKYGFEDDSGTHLIEITLDGASVAVDRVYKILEELSWKGKY